LKGFIAYAEKELNLPILQEFLDATPTAELEPITKDYVQSDEIDMGMTYEELSICKQLWAFVHMFPLHFQFHLMYSDLLYPSLKEEITLPRPS